MSLQWVKDVNEGVKKAKEDGKPLLNEDGIKTDAQDPAYMYDYPWLAYEKDDEKRKNSVSSIMVNDYCKEVLRELNKRTDVSDRKRITRIVEAGLKALAKDIEQGKI